jgi:hypothetical protein
LFAKSASVSESVNASDASSSVLVQAATVNESANAIDDPFVYQPAAISASVTESASATDTITVSHTRLIIHYTNLVDRDSLISNMVFDDQISDLLEADSEITDRLLIDSTILNLTDA